MNDSKKTPSQKVIVSACLAGLKCRYDCQSKERLQIVEMVKKGEAIPVCPEQMGGLPTPRPPAEVQGQKVVTNTGIDVTNSYKNGAEEALKIAILFGAKEAFLKSRSPMCGAGRIYDGNFTGQLIDGNGVFAELCIKNGIKIHTVE